MTHSAETPPTPKTTNRPYKQFYHSKSRTKKPKEICDFQLGLLGLLAYQIFLRRKKNAKNAVHDDCKHRKRYQKPTQPQLELEFQRN